MGDFHKEEFSEEELKALGGAEEKPPEPAPESQGEPAADAEKPPEEAKPEGEPEKPPETEQKPAEEAKTEEGTVEETKDPVQKRIDKLTWEKNEERRKRDLAITLGPEKFFELYPEEKPEGWQPAPKAEPKPQAQPAAPVQPLPSLAQLGHMQVKGWQYDGMTLNEVALQDPMAAMAIRDNFVATVRQQQAKQHDEQTKAEIEREVQTFNSTRAFEMFGKSVRECTAAEIAKLKEAEAAAIEYIEKSGNPSLPLEHAYWKTVHEAKRRAKEAAEKKLDKVTDSPTVKSIGTGTVPGVDVEWQGWLSKTPEQLTRAIDKMTEAEYGKFLKNAPKQVRDKFKSVPWD